MKSYKIAHDVNDRFFAYKCLMSEKVPSEDKSWSSSIESSRGREEGKEKWILYCRCHEIITIRSNHHEYITPEELARIAQVKQRCHS